MIVFIVCVIGFVVVLHGLFQDLPNFKDYEHTLRALFDAAVGQHDFTEFDYGPNHYLGIFIMGTYITLTMVVLINLVIARMAVSVSAFSRYLAVFAKN